MLEDNTYSFYDNSGSWSDDYSSSFDWDYPEVSSSFDTNYFGGDTYADQSWYSDAWDFAKSDTGAGLIGGVASGALKGYEIMQAQDLSKENRDFRERQLALQEKQMEAGSAAAAAALAFQYAVLNDKIKTRAKHNETINTAPTTPQRVKIG